eukprot:TRINITY_DN30299_c0_g1_i8.p1 TRINITY_DN30299_c0_g1~~TRINITY_DN30299_c0_g1_i8.p1  ORF type:complete len:170 (-),score=61.67 TRINITY_DN30299_c0_g1_i8:76-585(-)
MAFARLFGKNKKEDKETSPGEHQEVEGYEGFTVLESRQGGHPPSVYPSLGTANLPYLLPGGPPGAVVMKNEIVGSFGGPGGGGAGQVGDPELMRQQSDKHPLDGVHFSLSPRLTTDTELQYMVTAVDSVMARMKNIEWGALEYSFALERSVLETQGMGEELDGLTMNSQ